ncbi:MAG: ATP-grasp domain-containing protein [Bdellovibrionales bacterium]|nr:ATP-grasp domain-containing protein [Bdellovibrionales bacterium]
MSRPFHVLITGSGTVTCQSVIKALKNQNQIDVQITTVDMNEDAAGKFLSDSFHIVPAAKDPNFIVRMLEICSAEKVDLVIPIVDYEFTAFAKHREEFEEQGTKVAISSLETIENCNDKWKTNQFFKRIGVETPQSYLPESLPSQPSFPLFIKPQVMGRSSIDSFRVNNENELSFYLEKVDRPIIQECFEAEEFTVDVLCDFDSKAVNAVPRLRIETKSGVSYKGKTVRDQLLIEQAAQIAEELKIVGPCNIQCFRLKDKAVFFEVNPRYSGTLALTVAAGFNSPVKLCQLARGDKVDISLGDFQDGVLMLRYWQEVFSSSTHNEGYTMLSGIEQRPRPEALNSKPK